MHTNQPRPRAPYSVFENGVFLRAVPTLTDLHALLVARLKAELFEREAFEKRRCSAGAYGIWLRDFQPKELSVEDATGARRTDLETSWRLRRFIEEHRGEDVVWDGDARPRGVPVPGTGRWSPYSKRYRHPATQQERAKSFWVAEEGEPPVRNARRWRELPSVWDDRPRASYGAKSWKLYRKHQWRE